MLVRYEKRENLSKALKEESPECLDFIILSIIEGPNDFSSLQFDTKRKEKPVLPESGNATARTEAKSWFALLDEACAALKQEGILMVQGTPDLLPMTGVHLEKHLVFKYWIAVSGKPLYSAALPNAHTGVLIFVNGKQSVPIRQVRLPHPFCTACGRTLKDWGGKSHLMHPDGHVISDVIKDLPLEDNHTRISAPLMKLLLQIPREENRQNSPLKGIVGPVERVETRSIAATSGREDKESLFFVDTRDKSEPVVSQRTPSAKKPRKNAAVEKNISSLPDSLVDTILLGDSLEILAKYPDESVDLVFADPPYNLDKGYSAYEDEKIEKNYISWCNRWLFEYIRILKPTGSLYVLNLPRWAMHHAVFLHKYLVFQNWIAWDALSEPRGKIMPAHYALLFYTKKQTGFTFNYDGVSPIDSRKYCLRAACIRNRRETGENETTPLTDIWWDIHRIRHKKNRDTHPCQLPHTLMERIIRLSSNPGDLVLDALAGTGTTPVTALMLNRHYVGIDMDPEYVRLMNEKIQEAKENGSIFRAPVKKKGGKVTKKALQLELGRMAKEMGRLPTPEDVKKNSRFELSLFLENFTSWGKALAAAKLEVRDDKKSS